MHTKYLKPVFSSIVLLLTTGCVQSLPAISHAHLGHALTAWHDTPDNQGLLVVAQREADNALKELKLANQASASPRLAKDHVKNIVHSLNPEQQQHGSGQGYGVLPALKRVRQHVNFAANTEDASKNVVQSEKTFSTYSSANYDQFLLALAQARLTTNAAPSTIALHLPVLEDLLTHAVQGKDLDHDGVIGNIPEEVGLIQLQKQLADLVANEVAPTYEPIGKSYLLGLIRLPDGGWAYQLDNGMGQENEGGGGY